MADVSVSVGQCVKTLAITPETEQPSLERRNKLQILIYNDIYKIHPSVE